MCAEQAKGWIIGDLADGLYLLQDGIVYVLHNDISRAIWSTLKSSYIYRTAVASFTNMV